MPNLKRYQEDAVSNAIEIFGYAKHQLDRMDKQDRQSWLNAVAHNGCVLIQAPTGAGKTLIAGRIAEEMVKQHEERVVWLWFTPFVGLVEQARRTIRAQFPSLRLRDIKEDRRSVGTRSGDVYVTTWSNVAVANKESRAIRKDGEASVSLDRLIRDLREDGYRIGTIVDEAHHSFRASNEAVSFYTSILSPEYTVLVTATPDDRDIESFKEATYIKEVHRISISRMDAVDAGLIKKGIKSIAYLAPDSQSKNLLDFELAALSDGVRTHRRIQSTLREAGVPLSPLMLVQVDSSENSIKQAREKLITLGVEKDAIAQYTADEPNDDLIAVANDPTKEVLIFKMAVALGFDAPRAFILVSMRGSRKTDFGIQVVGRILRVHSLLQARTAPGLLSYGYVFLADAENQAGLTSAAERINAITTGMSEICPYTMVVSIAGVPEVQVIENGQSHFNTRVEPSRSFADDQQPPQQDGVGSVGPAGTTTQGSFFLEMLDATSGGVTSGRNQSTENHGVRSNSNSDEHEYPLKLIDDPVRFVSERLPIQSSQMIDAIAAKITFDDTVLNASLRRVVSVIREEREIFSKEIDSTTVSTPLSQKQVAIKAQRLLFEFDYIDPRELRNALVRRLKKETTARGWSDVAESADKLDDALDIILVTFPSILREAQKRAAADYTEIFEAEPIPRVYTSFVRCDPSRMNVYGVVPSDLNRWERAFASALDTEFVGAIDWWHRNPSRKPHSLALVLPNGQQFFPDFIIKVKNRKNEYLLVETKEAINREDSILKAISEHKRYGKVMMLNWENEDRWMTVRYNANKDKNELDSVLRDDLLAFF